MNRNSAKGIMAIAVAMGILLGIPSLAPAAQVMVHFVNWATGLNDTNYFTGEQISQNILTSGGVQPTGLPARMYPGTNGYATNYFGLGWFAVWDPALEPQGWNPTLNQGTVPQDAAVISVNDSSQAQYDYTNLLRSGFNMMVTVINPTNLVVTFTSVTNALGGQPPVAVSPTNGSVALTGGILFVPTNYDWSGAAASATNPIPTWINGSTNPIPGWVSAATNPVPGWISATNTANLTVTTNLVQAATNPIPSMISAATNPIPTWINGSTNPIPGWVSAATNPVPGWISATNTANLTVTTNLVQAATNPIPSMISAATNPIPTWINASTNPIPGWVSAATNPVPGWISATNTANLTVTTNLVQAATNPIPSMISAATNPIPTWINASTNPIPGWVSASSAQVTAALVASNLAAGYQLAFVQGELDRETNDLVLTGAGTSAANGTNVYAGGQQWTNLTGVSLISGNLTTGAVVYVSGLAVYGGPTPLGPFTNLAGASPTPVAIFMVKSNSAGTGIVISRAFGVSTFTATASAPVFGPGTNTVYALQGQTNTFNVPFGIFDLFGAANASTNPVPGWISTGTQAATNPIPTWINASTNPIPGWVQASTNPVPGWISATNTANLTVTTNLVQAATNPIPSMISAATNPIPTWINASTNPIPGWVSAATNPVPGWISATNTANLTVTTNLVQAATNPIPSMISAATNPIPPWINASTNPIPTWIQASTNPIPGWISASNTASLTVTTGLVQNAQMISTNLTGAVTAALIASNTITGYQLGFVQGELDRDTNNLVLAGAGSAASNGTNVWAGGSTWTNLTGVSGVVGSQFAGATDFVSGVAFYGGPTPLGPWTNIAGASPAPGASFMVKSNAAGIGITISGPVFGVRTITANQAISGLDTNLFSVLSQDDVLVSPVTNLPSIYLTNPFYFSPALGPNYVQLAINSLPVSTSRLQDGGGRITVAGQNFYPNPLLFSNSVAGVNAYDVESPNAFNGALVCATNPAIRVFSTNANVAQFMLRNLIVSTLVNQKTNLLEMAGGVYGKLDIEFNWFGPWAALTNNQDTYGWAGLTPTSTGISGYHPDLVAIYIPQVPDDQVSLSHNSFFEIQCLDLGFDHGDEYHDFFSFCAHDSDWTNTSPYSLNVAIHQGGNIHGDYVAEDNYFYGGNAGYPYHFRANTNPSRVETISDRFEGVLPTYLLDSTATALIINPHLMPSTAASALVVTNSPYGISNAIPNGYRLVDLLNSGSITEPVTLGSGLTVYGNVGISGTNQAMVIVATASYPTLYVSNSVNANRNGTWNFCFTNTSLHYGVWTNSPASTNVIVYNDPQQSGVFFLEESNGIGQEIGAPQLIARGIGLQIMGDQWGDDANVSFWGLIPPSASMKGNTVTAGNVVATNITGTLYGIATLAPDGNTNASLAEVTNIAQAQVLGLNWKSNCLWATTGTLPANTYNNGSSGVGATLTGVSVGALTVDGGTVNVGDRVLVKNEAAAANNGIYVVMATGSVVAVYVLTRAVDYNQAGEIAFGDAVYILQGSANTNSFWRLTSANPITVGTSALNYSLTAGPLTISGDGTGSSPSAGGNIVLTVTNGGNLIKTSVGVQLWGGSFSGGVGIDSAIGGSIKVPAGAGSGQYGYFMARPVDFNNARGTNFVLYLPIYATNSSGNFNVDWFASTNNGFVHSPNNANITPTMAVSNWTWVTISNNLPTGTTNLLGISAELYNNGSYPIWIDLSSAYLTNF